MVRTVRRDAVLTNGGAVNPQGIRLSRSAVKRDEVASAVLSREQSHDSSVGVLDLVGLRRGEASAVPSASDGDGNSLAGVVGDLELPVSESKGTVQGAEGKQSDEGLVHVDRYSFCKRSTKCKEDIN